MVLMKVKMKTCFAILLSGHFLLAGFDSNAQKLKTERFDAGIKKWQLETFPVSLKAAPDAKTAVTLSATDTAVRLYLAGSGVGTSTVDLGSELVFILENDSTVVARSTAIQGIDFESLVSSYRHQYEISQEGLKALSRHPIKALRKFSAGGVDVISIEKKNAGKVSELSRTILAKLKEKKLLPENYPVIAAGFPGGQEVFKRFLNRNLKKVEALQHGEKKTVTALLQIGADGMVKDIQLRNSTDGALESELLRILQRMPKWKPALQNSKPVAFNLTQSFSFVRSGDLVRIDF